MNTFNTLNYEKESTKTNENNERNETNGKIKLKKVRSYIKKNDLLLQIAFTLKTIIKIPAR